MLFLSLFCILGFANINLWMPALCFCYCLFYLLYNNFGCLLSLHFLCIFIHTH